MLMGLFLYICTFTGPLKSVGIVCCSGKWGMLQLGNDPTGNTTRILSALLAEMVPLFPDSVVHIGGDETQYETSGSVINVLTTRTCSTTLMGRSTPGSSTLPVLYADVRSILVVFQC